ncbi:hypothetical protein HZ989_11715 [Brevundimonas sp. AJA228-03]|uniref:hypothetical protein n=1 Tax=Brevundimonas sp. AJA228-03 TaxID=2752515 RepID=UPI001AE0E1F8|nr:hypothetical protein [Brevundimonas sp. AJA228-03]QTN18896.1 hypothetical protein HZ989_11715 [Brevundimonas sp. AJA228-03]
MSADEIDPMIERLFARTPQMADATLFAADVETKLQSSTRVRTLALTLAGVVGGIIAVRESMNVTLNLTGSQAPVAGRVIGQGIQSASLDVQGAVASGLSQMGLADMTLGSMGGMQLFWIAAGALIALAAAGVMKLSQDV